ncbi:heterokaryon incompatibility protein-domain-containing protein [Phyllosticta capitalensis]
MWDLAIEIRPGRGLLLSRMGKPCMTELTNTGEYLHDISCLWFCALRPSRAPIEFFTTNDSVPHHPSFGPSTDVPMTFEVDSIRDTLRAWLIECDAKHNPCQTVENGKGVSCPKRLVRVAEGDIKVFELDSDSKVTYTTLSHCWGSEVDAARVLKALTTNIRSLQVSITWTEIPPIFQDAIKITRLVSCDYIWIDSLCIIQDDDEDWKNQATQMAKIYSQSYLNIATTASKNSWGGLFKQRVFSLDPTFDLKEAMTKPLESHSLKENIFARPYLEQVHRAFYGAAIEMTAKGSPFPLLQRAWIFQERLLSRRTVHFTRSEMVWECRSHTFCECEDSSDTEEVSQLWWNCVQNYTQLMITKSTDWPHAIAGLASRVLPYLRSNYAAGLWEKTLPFDLLWSRQWPGPIEDYEISDREWPFHSSSFPRTPPTWSWLNFRVVATGREGSVGHMTKPSRFLVDGRFRHEFGEPIETFEDNDEAGFWINHSGRPLVLEGASRKGHILLNQRPRFRYPRLDGNFEDEIYYEDDSASKNGEVFGELDELFAIPYKHDPERCIFSISLDFKFPESLNNHWYPVQLLCVGKSSIPRGRWLNLDLFLILAAVPGENHCIRIGTGSFFRKRKFFQYSEVCRAEVR